MRFMGSMCVIGEDRLDPGRRWRTSRAMIEPIIGKDGVHPGRVCFPAVARCPPAYLPAVISMRMVVPLPGSELFTNMRPL